ncbi:hypothetical protein [Haloferula sp.]|jgi:hypothetical protein|uniref:hypothetical protein n=1 Tax=Haloferula sp. TaxID=2497595 RepID=UPI003C710F7D
MKRIFTIPFLVLAFATSAIADVGKLQGFLNAGKHGDAIAYFADPSTDEARFSRSVAQLLAAVERTSQGFYRYGIHASFADDIPILRLPVPVNPHPEPATNEHIRNVIARFHLDLHEIETSLGALEGNDFQLPLDVTSIRIDFNGDGTLDDDDWMHTLFSVYRPDLNQQMRSGKPLLIDFDLGDAYWLQGYTQILLGISDLLLAHDTNPVFEAIGHALFRDVDTAMGRVLGEPGVANERRWRSYDKFADLIAAVHAVSLDVTEPDRLKNARLHFINMSSSSRTMWKAILAETDDRNEWLPSPKQSSVTQVPITSEMVDSWELFLREYEGILDGRILIPHWRFDGKGINLRKVFEEPSPLDLVQWIQGRGALPYLEYGPLSDRNNWDRILRGFQGQFFGMAFWIN